MEKLTAADLLKYLQDNKIPEDAEIMFEDGNETGVNIEKVYLERVGNTYCLIFQSKGVSLNT